MHRANSFRHRWKLLFRAFSGRALPALLLAALALPGCAGDAAPSSPQTKTGDTGAGETGAGETGAGEAAAGQADLVVRTPEGWDAPINYDTAAMSIGVAWANHGSGMAEDYSIVLVADGEVIYRWEKPLLAPGSERVEVLELRELPDPQSLSPGPHTLELMVDANHSVAESDERNNHYSAGMVDVVLPNLTPGAPAARGWDAPVVFGGAGLVHGRDGDPADRGAFLAYAVSNSGDIAANSWGRGDSVIVNGRQVSARLFTATGDRDAASGQVSVNAIPVWILALLSGPLPTGRHQVAITIDAENTLVEANEGDNLIAAQVSLSPTRRRTGIGEHRPSGADSPPRVHAVYAIPADAPDEEWDISGVIEGIIADMQSWLRQRTGGRALVFDEDDGSLAVTFVRLESRAGEIDVSAHPWRPLVQELHRRGLNDPRRIYAVWTPFAPQTAGDSICGVQTEHEGVKFAFSFYERSSPGEFRCINQPTTMVHEVAHAMGAVAPCAPNYYSDSETASIGHVDDHPNDLLYGGGELGSPVLLDEGNDDYFMHEIPDCPDLADSPYLGPARAIAR